MKRIILIFCLIFSWVYSEENMIENFEIKGKEKKSEASMDIEITKLFSEELLAEIDTKNKEINLDIEDKGKVMISENLRDFLSASVDGEGNSFMKRLNISQALSDGKEIKDGNFTYEIISFGSLRKLNIDYKIYPKDLYLAILDSNNEIEKVYKLEFIKKQDKIEGFTFIIEENSHMIFNIEDNKNQSKTMTQDVYEARAILSFQLEDQGIELDIEVNPKEEEVDLVEVGSKDGSKKIKVRKLRTLEEKVIEEEIEGKIYKKYKYEIIGEIEREDIYKLEGADTFRGIDMSFAGKVGVQVEIK